MSGGGGGEDSSSGAVLEEPSSSPSTIVGGGRAIAGLFLARLQDAEAGFILKMCTYMLGDSPWARFNKEDILNDGGCGKVYALQIREKLARNINNVTEGSGLAIKIPKAVSVHVGPAGDNRGGHILGTGMTSMK